MLDRQGFEDWAAEYDAFVDRSKSAGTYPFCGYDSVHDRVLSLLAGCKAVVDLGIGTARLTSRLYDRGVKIYGVDFSENMLAAARKKMPDAKLILADLTKGLPKELNGVKPDAMISLYAIHHLTDAGKARLISEAAELMPGGRFIIGDVSFRTAADRDECMASSPDFDRDEHYCIFDELKKLVPYRMEFEEMSFCAGVTIIYT